MQLFSNDLGVDLGTANVLIYEAKNGVVVREPAVVAILCLTRLQINKRSSHGSIKKSIMRSRFCAKSLKTIK